MHPLVALHILSVGALIQALRHGHVHPHHIRRLYR